MPLVKSNALRSRTARTKRRGAATITKAKFKPKTARNNRQLIMSNAKAISMLRKMQGPSIYTDYQYNDEFPVIPSTTENTQKFTEVLASPDVWRACLRTDQNVLDSSTTYWRNMTLNIRVNLGLADYAQWSIFVVTPRRDNSAFSFDTADLIEGRQYILGPEGFNPILNSNQFKCLAVKHISLTNNAWKQPIAQLGADDTLACGNAFSTYRKYQVNIKCKARIRNPQNVAAPVGTNTWKTMSVDNMPYYHKYYMIAFCRSKFSVSPSSGAPPCQASFHQLNTCINDN